MCKQLNDLRKRFIATAEMNNHDRKYLVRVTGFCFQTLQFIYGDKKQCRFRQSTREKMLRYINEYEKQSNDTGVDMRKLNSYKSIAILFKPEMGIEPVILRYHEMTLKENKLAVVDTLGNIFIFNFDTICYTKDTVVQKE
jgi:hypothetical protein